jgi:hypothetical protein
MKHRIAVAIVVTFAVVTLITYLSGTFNSPPGPPIYATRLKVTSPSAAKVGNTIQIGILAVDNQSRIDYRRDDIVQITLNAEARAVLNATQVSLKNGQTVVTLRGVVPEQVIIHVSWISGYSSLQSATATVTFSES